MVEQLSDEEMMSESPQMQMVKKQSCVTDNTEGEEGWDMEDYASEEDEYIDTSSKLPTN
jgi:hypothetical protein